MNPAFATYEDDLQSEILLRPKSSRTRSRMQSESGGRHIGHYWSSEIPLHEGPLARSISIGGRPASMHSDVVRVVPYSASARTRRDSLQRDYERDRRDYDEDEEYFDRDRTRRRRRTPGPSERSSSPPDSEIREKLRRLEELEERAAEKVKEEMMMKKMRENMMMEEMIMKKRREEMMKEEMIMKKMREEMRAREIEELLLSNKLHEKRGEETGGPAELDGGKRPKEQEADTSLEKRDGLDKDGKPEKHEEAATLRRHVELEGDNGPGDEEETRTKWQVREQEAFREMQKQQEEIKQRTLLVKAKEEVNKSFEERVKAKFCDAGFSEEDAERILKEQREKRAKEEEKSSDGPVLSRRTYVKVNRKYIVPETLDAHHLPWEPDERDENFIIIKRWIPKELQEELFEHTRRIKERNLRAFDGDVKQDDKLYIIRKKSPEVSRRSWMFS